jgi:hypothetical protein
VNVPSLPVWTLTSLPYASLIGMNSRMKQCCTCWSDTQFLCFTLIRAHHHHVLCLTTDPYSFPKRVLHRLRYSATSFNFQYSLVSLLFLPRFSVTSILLALFSITCFRRRFLPTQLASLYFVVSACRMFLFSLTLCDTSSHLTRSFQLIFSIIPEYYILKLSKYF